MESSSPSERTAAPWSGDVGDSICNGPQVDVERQHQPVREGTSGCKSVRAGKFWSKLVLLYPLLTIDWFSQLVDVAEGLVYMHEQGMVHGDLKGVCSL